MHVANRHVVAHDRARRRVEPCELCNHCGLLPGRDGGVVRIVAIFAQRASEVEVRRDEFELPAERARTGRGEQRVGRHRMAAALSCSWTAFEFARQVTTPMGSLLLHEARRLRHRGKDASARQPSFRFVRLARRVVFR